MMASYSESEVQSAAEAVYAKAHDMIPTGIALVEGIHHLRHFPEQKECVLLIENLGFWIDFGKDVVALYLEHYKLSFAKPLVRRYLDFRAVLNLEKIPQYFANKFMQNPDLERLLATGDVKLSRRELSIVFTSFAGEVCDFCQRAVIQHFKSLKQQCNVAPQLLHDDAGIMLLARFALKKVLEYLEENAVDTGMFQIAKAVTSSDKDFLLEDLTDEERSLLSERDMGGISFFGKRIH